MSAATAPRSNPFAPMVAIPRKLWTSAGLAIGLPAASGDPSAAKNMPDAKGC